MGYVVLVRATDFVGLSIEAVSNDFIVDETPPVDGWVTIDAPSAKDFLLNQISSRYLCITFYLDHNFLSIILLFAVRYVTQYGPLKATVDFRPKVNKRSLSF